MKNTRMEPRDVEASYHNTIIMARRKEGSRKDLRPFHITGVGTSDSGEPTVSGRLYIGGGKTTSMSGRLYSDLETDFTWPTLGMTNFRSGAVYRSRVAERQWKRGVRDRALRVHMMSSTVMESLRDGRFNLTRDYDFYHPESVESLFYPEYTPLDQAIKSISDMDRIGAALSQEFALGLHAEISGIVVYQGHNIVGVVVGDRVSFFESARYAEKLFYKQVAGA